MIKNNLQLLDMDEHLRDIHELQQKEVLKFCRQFELTLDLASSDVVIFLSDKQGNYICLG